jgi:transcriptional accessory protein Tex/SPT6
MIGSRCNVGAADWIDIESQLHVSAVANRMQDRLAMLRADSLAILQVRLVYDDYQNAKHSA